MNASMGPEEFWRDPTLVDAYAARTAALDYERDAICQAVDRARAGGPVDVVHVLGVGAGRELAAVRDAAPGATICAWDLSPEMVDASRGLVAANGWKDVQVETADVRDLVHRTAAHDADVVIGLGAVMGYLTDPDERRRAFAGLSNLGRPGAGLALVVQQQAGRPDWACWFALRRVLDAAGSSSQGVGNRASRHGSGHVAFHHYTRKELRGLMAWSQDLSIESLRQWGRRHGRRIPSSSPNPLILTASVPATQ